jgi:hypothetical protein
MTYLLIVLFVLIPTPVILVFQAIAKLIAVRNARAYEAKALRELSA